ncbi:uncharacterized protein AC631_05201 [Debaryomyces fabryi]|uniref:Uncharacterized protein n=1 Tax=Debaryomyces fabryi TaxID=58627 RepID=A0A0V1PSB0_9ASCO|nr:uncharacterized protein AC631_05201 [Debaryomyces fabryi]KRZ99033.1 hypothetical protein AC631_05201 [Debaryomyces fabryi]CUM55903.1 unnamed protein product [Debaryomyces fabryi]
MSQDECYKMWSSERLAFFLLVRGCTFPNGLSREELEDLVKEKANVPILKVPINETTIRQLIPDHLISWLFARDYIVTPKAKPMLMVPEDNAIPNYKEFLRVANNDYKDKILLMDEASVLEAELQLAKILQTKYAFLTQPTEDWNFMEHRYRNADLDIILELFGFYDKYPMMKNKGLQSKQVLAKTSVDFFATGSL